MPKVKIMIIDVERDESTVESIDSDDSDGDDVDFEIKSIVKSCQEPMVSQGVASPLFKSSPPDRYPPFLKKCHHPFLGG